MNGSPLPEELQGHEGGASDRKDVAAALGAGRGTTLSLVVLMLFALVCAAIVLLIRSPSDEGPDAVFGVIGIAGERGASRPKIVSLLSKEELRMLQARGIPDPQATIAAELGPGRGIVLRTGQPGELAGFYFGPDAKILNEKWVVAGINDGRRRRGEVMLEYRVADDRTITWAVVSARLIEPANQ